MLVVPQRDFPLTPAARHGGLVGIDHADDARMRRSLAWSTLAIGPTFQLRDALKQRPLEKVAGWNHGPAMLPRTTAFTVEAEHAIARVLNAASDVQQIGATINVTYLGRS